MGRHNIALLWIVLSIGILGGLVLANSSNQDGSNKHIAIHKAAEREHKPSKIKKTAPAEQTKPTTDESVVTVAYVSPMQSAKTQRRLAIVATSSTATTANPNPAPQSNQNDAPTSPPAEATPPTPNKDNDSANQNSDSLPAGNIDSQTINVLAGGISESFTISSPDNTALRWFSTSECATHSDEVLPDKSSCSAYIVIESPIDADGGVLGSSLSFHIRATNTAATGEVNGGPNGFGFAAFDPANPETPPYVALFHVVVATTNPTA